MNPMKRRNTRLVVKVWGVGIGLLLAGLLLVAAELFVRATLPRKNPLRHFVSAPITEGIIDTGGSCYVFDSELTYRLRPNLRNFESALTRFNTNAQGIRRDVDIEAKRPGQLRIAFYGDSTTFGNNVPCVLGPGDVVSDEDRCFVDRVEKSLRAALPGRDVEVLNFGVCGYNSRQGAGYMRRTIARYRPDIVLAAFFANDVQDYGLTDRQVQPQTAMQIQVREFAASSQMVLHLLAWKDRRFTRKRPPGYALPRNTLEGYISAFDDMREICESNGARFIVIDPIFRDADGDIENLGYRLPVYRKALRQYSQAAGLDHILIPPMTEEHSPANHPLFIEHVHPNGEGHVLIAKRLHEYLLPLVQGVSDRATFASGRRR